MPSHSQSRPFTRIGAPLAATLALALGACAGNRSAAEIDMSLPAKSWYGSVCQRIGMALPVKKNVQ